MILFKILSIGLAIPSFLIAIPSLAIFFIRKFDMGWMIMAAAACLVGALMLYVPLNGNDPWFNLIVAALKVILFMFLVHLFGRGNKLRPPVSAR